MALLIDFQAQFEYNPFEFTGPILLPMSVTPTQGQPQDDLALAKAVITSLQLALKMFTLYAEDHMYCQKSVVRLHGEI